MLTGYDDTFDGKMAFVGAGLCVVCADVEARRQILSGHSPCGTRWLHNMYMNARAWESAPFKPLLEQLTHRVSPASGFSMVAPRLISGLWPKPCAMLLPLGNEILSSRTER